MTESKLPPVTELAVLSMALIVAAGIYIASHLPHHVPLGPAAGLLGASAVLVLVNVVSLTRAPRFNWPLFFSVGKWALAAYCVIAGMLEYVFIRDDTRGATLLVLTLSLLVFAIHVPLLIGFTVARFQPREMS